MIIFKVKNRFVAVFKWEWWKGWILLLICACKYWQHDQNHNVYFGFCCRFGVLCAFNKHSWSCILIKRVYLCSSTQLGGKDCNCYFIMEKLVWHQCIRKTEFCFWKVLTKWSAIAMNLNRIMQTSNLIKGQRKIYTVYIGIAILSHLKERIFLFLLCSPNGPAVVTFWLTWCQYSAKYFGSCSTPSTFLHTGRCQV